MKAAVLHAFDGPLEVEQIDRPSTGAGEVLVRVAASGVNPLDVKIRMGQGAHAKPVVPAVLGLDLAGWVEEVGEGVTGFVSGDEVGGIQGSLAEFAAVDARLIARKPQVFSMREAAAVPLVFITVWEGLVDRPASRQVTRSWSMVAAVVSDRWRSRSPSHTVPTSSQPTPQSISVGSPVSTPRLLTTRRSPWTSTSPSTPTTQASTSSSTVRAVPRSTRHSRQSSATWATSSAPSDGAHTASPRSRSEGRHTRASSRCSRC